MDGLLGQESVHDIDSQAPSVQGVVELTVDRNQPFKQGSPHIVSYVLLSRAHQIYLHAQLTKYLPFSKKLRSISVKTPYSENRDNLRKPLLRLII